MSSLLGVDACKAGWCVAAIRHRASGWEFVGVHVSESFHEILGDLAELICVDIPIGLLDEPGHRLCDKEARRRLGKPRGSSVFPPPSRKSLTHEDYRAASSANLRATGKGLSKQSFAIGRKIREVDSLISPHLQERVREVHPELCIWSLNGGHAALWNKKAEAGREERWRLLTNVIASLPSEPESLARPGCKVDDAIDALAAAWTAACIVGGHAQVVPEEPQVDQRGLRMEMWFPRISRHG